MHSWDSLAKLWSKAFFDFLEKIILSNAMIRQEQFSKSRQNTCLKATETVPKNLKEKAFVKKNYKNWKFCREWAYKDKSQKKRGFIFQSKYFPFDILIFWFTFLFSRHLRVLRHVRYTYVFDFEIYIKLIIFSSEIFFKVGRAVFE